MQQELEKLEKFFIWKQKKLLIKLVEKWTELLIILQKETNFLRDAAVLEKLEKNGAFATLAGEGGVADNSAEETRKVRAGEARENAAVLKKLGKNGAFAKFYI